MGVDDQTVKMFQSALYPALVTFMTEPSDDDKEALDRAIAQLNLNRTHADKLGKIMGADADDSVSKRIDDLRRRLAAKCKVGRASDARHRPGHFPL